MPRLRWYRCGVMEGNAMSLHGDNPTTACGHEPRELIAAFVHVCKHCHQPIERADCKACAGHGDIEGEDGRIETCEECDGTREGEWEVVL